MKAWINGEFVDWKEATVPILSHGFGRGAAIFEVVDIVSAAKGPAFFGLKEHVDRFFNSATYMYITIPLSKDDIIRACIDTAQENNVSYGAAKFFAYYSAIELDVVPHDKQVDIAVFCLDFGSPKAGRMVMSEPVSAGISSYRKIHPESVPVHAKTTGNYVSGYLAKMAAKEQGYQDVILLDTMGFVAEAATANLFIVNDNKIKTPTLRSVLPGINRMAILEILEETTYIVEKTDIRPDELFACDEAFYTSSVTKIMPIKSIDGKTIGSACPGKVTQTIADRAREVYNGKVTKFDKWLTYI